MKVYATSEFLKKLNEKMILLVIDEGGLPIFQYPPTPNGFEMLDNDNDVLFSGLLTAINSIGQQIIGDDVQQISFGSLFLSFSRDKWDHLYVYIFTEPPKDKDLLERLHLETMGLFNHQIKPILHAASIPLISSEKKEKDDLMVRSIIQPFFKLWTKRMN